MSRWTRANPLAAVPGYGVPPGHFANGYTNGGDRVGFKRGGSVRDTTRNPHKDPQSTKPRRPRREKLPDSAYWRKSAKKGGWIQDVNKSIKKRGTKGKCTPITKPGCTGRAKALAKTFKKMARKRKG